MDSISNKIKDNMKNIVFSIKFSENDIDIDGKLILGDIPMNMIQKNMMKKIINKLI